MERPLKEEQMAVTTSIPMILDKHRDELLEGWLSAQLAGPTRRPDLIGEGELRRQSARFLDLLGAAAVDGELESMAGAGWDDLRDMLTDLSRERVTAGFSPSETATFVFSLKQPLFEAVGREHADDPQALQAEAWRVTALLDRLGLYTVETFLGSREEIIRLQQREMLELSTPVVRLWEGVLALPLIGTLDSARTQVVMENLLGASTRPGRRSPSSTSPACPPSIRWWRSTCCKTAAAARLMGAEVIISGIRPQIAQTIVQLGVDISR